MPATFPATKAESWADAMILRPAGDPDPEGMWVFPALPCSKRVDLIPGRSFSPSLF